VGSNPISSTKCTRVVTVSGRRMELVESTCFRSRVASRTRATKSAKVILWAQYGAKPTAQQPAEVA
jgi:hypothetical protein